MMSVFKDNIYLILVNNSGWVGIALQISSVFVYFLFVNVCMGSPPPAALAEGARVAPSDCVQSISTSYHRQLDQLIRFSW